MSTETKNTNVGVNDLIANIKENLTQRSASVRDETRVMQAMLNDKDFSVTTYNNDGSTTQHCPATDVRNMMAGIIASTTHISNTEAQAVADAYDFKKSDAATMVQISKDFMSTTLRTGRKVKFGGTERSDISIQLKEIPEATKRFPRKNGEDDNGNPVYENGTSTIPAHEGLKVSNPCPPWVK